MNSCVKFKNEKFISFIAMTKKQRGGENPDVSARLLATSESIFCINVS